MNDPCGEILKAAKRLYDKDLLAACDGNISMCTADAEILVTPSGKQKAFMEVADMARCTRNGTVLQGNPSSELAMHLAIYRCCPAAKAVVHAHPPYAIAWSLANRDKKRLPTECLPELLLALGECPVVGYTIPGSEAMGEALIPYLPMQRAFILQFHGALAWGESLAEAVGGIERIEHAAKILSIAAGLGPLASVSAAELEKLRALRAKIHPRIV